MSFIKVLTDVDGDISSIPARIVSNEKDGSFNIQYLSKTDKKHTSGKTIWEYEVEIYNITDESIDEYMYDEGDMGFKFIEDGVYIRESKNYDSGDDDYVPSSGSDEDTEEESSDESDEDEEDEEDLEDYDD
jgi:hypothetical protein